MNKELNFNFCKYRKEIEENVVPIVYSEKNAQPEVTEEKQLLKIIFAQGADGFPVGDLAYFVGNKSNPEVQAYILKNLMSDVSGQAAPSIAGLSDEQITTLTRQSGESVADYCSRLNSSIDHDKYIIASAKRTVSTSTDENQPTQ